MSELYGWIGGALAVLAAIVGIFFKGRSAGKKSEQAKQVQSDLAAEQKRNEVQNASKRSQESVDSLSDADVRQRLRDKWTKDNH